MKMPQYVGPRRGLLPALEQNMLKHRAMQMMLVIFYAEDLRGEIIDAVETPARFRKMTEEDEAEPKPPESDGEVKEKKRLGKAFGTLVAKGVITQEERQTIEKLIGFRNSVAHELHNMTSDLSNEHWARDRHKFLPKSSQYNPDAAEQLQHYSRLISQRLWETHEILSFRDESLIFRAAERVFKVELKRLEKIIEKQRLKRNAENASIRAELDLKGTELVGEFSPRHPHSHYDDRRLTRRGVEICYRLFDMGKSTIAVAYLTGLSLAATRKRRKMWEAIGSHGRSKVDLAAIPVQRSPIRYED